MKKSVTAREVGALARVSQSAVSRTFTPGASVSEDTRRKVLAAAQQLGYRPNALARGLITRRSKIIALVMSYLENQFYPMVIEQLSARLQAEGRHILLFITDADHADALMASILEYQVDAIVMASTVLSPQWAQACDAAGVPVVLLNRVPDLRPQARAGTSHVVSDNRRGGWLAAQLLAQRGYRRIAFMAGLENASTSIEREAGFVQGLADAGLALHSRACGHYSFDGAQAAARALFRDPAQSPDAVFVANDHMAIATLDVLRHELQRQVPQEVGVVGFDNVPQAAWTSYGLTTVAQDVASMVAATVRLILQMEQGGRADLCVLPCELLERSSVRAAAPPI